MSYTDTLLLINNQWRQAKSGRSLPVTNPATDAEIGTVAYADLSDLDEALAAAQTGFDIWRHMTPTERGKIIRKGAQLLRDRVDSVASGMTQEQGKPLREAKAEVLSSADMLDWFAEEGTRVYGRIVAPRSNLALRQMVIKDPVGPVAAFTPWNFPINQVIRKVGAALAAGCSILIKGPEETPASPAALVRALVDAGLPPGVIGLVYGNPEEISSHLIRHPVIQKITFTGSTYVGKKLAALAGEYMKRSTMELGGHAPVIVCEDADIEVAIKASVAAKFRNSGQICIAPTRFLVHKSIAQEFSQEFAKLANKIQVGNGLDESTKMGPLTNRRRVVAMADLTLDAMSCGAKLLAGGERAGSTGNFWRPTVLADVPTNARVFNDEPFGPIAAIRSFETLDEAISEANRLSYGLAGYAFTSTLKNADALTRGLQVGMLWVNTQPITSAEMPFGGMKESGHGTEGGPEAIEAYLDTRSVAILNI